MKRDSTGPQRALEVIDELQFPLDPIAVLEFPRGLDLGAVIGPLLCPRGQWRPCKFAGSNRSHQRPGRDVGGL